MNACTHYGQSTCVHPGKRASAGTCAKCASFADSGVTRLTIKATRKQPEPVNHVPRDQWPFAARIIAKLATKEDAGIGSTIHRLAGRAGELYEWAFQAIAKKPCGCRDRAKWLDERYPYKPAAR